MEDLSAKKRALSYFSQEAFNCSQSVLGGNLNKLEINESEALKMAAGFGGGMRCGEVCGAVTGAIMSLGAKYGHSDGNDTVGKAKTGELVIEFETKFKDKFGSLLCKDLLEGNLGIAEEAEKIRVNKTIEERCPGFVAFAAETIEQIFNDN